MTERLLAFFQSLHGGWGYAFLFFSSLGENLFPPLPGDTFVVVGAVLVGTGRLGFFSAYAATTAGSILGFMTLFFIGRQWGRSFFDKDRRFFSQERLHRVESWFDRYGFWVIGANRFMSGFRGVVSLAAGIARLDWKRVLALAVLSCLIWNGLLMLLGLWLGSNWRTILENYQRIVFGILIAAILVWWIRIWIKKRRH